MKKNIITLTTLLFLQCINNDITTYKDETIEVKFTNKYKKSKTKCPLEDCLEYYSHETIPSEAMIIDTGPINENINLWLQNSMQFIKNEKEIITNEVVDENEDCQKAIITFKSDFLSDKAERVGLQLSSISLIKTKNTSRGLYWRHILTKNIENLPLLQKGLEESMKITLLNTLCKK
ncbi:hypothetical protein [Leptospira meyeri]|uniref:hypothetical protein n=1 Tax=Leptospira meyeri TaxID=29508 RepID=UPI000C2A63AD|nr:hypothetical protein [Leptospira meyeri]PJZ79206.1 hypothetical protein CH359_19220 [Leptospira meyeri]PJZ95027.1 hypothetical protein CH358_19250 [Leptospira meyeri]